MNVSEQFWNATFEELKCGFTQDKDKFICLLCGKRIEKGILYPEEGVFYEAERYMRIHIEKEHGSVFEYLSKMDKRLTGLSDHQNNLLRLFYQGKSDAEVQKEMSIGSSSTIRNHRFALKEKERQSKVFLVMMELLREKDKSGPGTVNSRNAAKTPDEVYGVTQDENEEILKKYFPEGTEGPLKTLTMKEKSRIIVLREIAKRFEVGSTYSEKEVNQVLEAVHEDYVTLRRYLIEYGFLDRKPDGSQYWLKSGCASKEEKNMDRKRELKQQYKEMKTEGGVYQIRNTKNQKVFVMATPNFKTINGKRIELERGGFRNSEPLQKEWNQYGEDAFVFEILETLEEKEDVYFDKKDELKKLEQKWLNKLQPYGERGYNKEKLDK